MSHIDNLTTWLNSAYAMERSLTQVLDNHSKEADAYPEIRQRLELHAEETRRHAELVAECLRLLEEEPSSVKSMIGNITGMVQGTATNMFRDAIVKNALSDYASEHFEIACYRSLIAAAQETGHLRIAEICREILREEEAMAQWLEAEIPTITRVFLEQAEHSHR